MVPPLLPSVRVYGGNEAPDRRADKHACGVTAVGRCPAALRALFRATVLAGQRIRLHALLSSITRRSGPDPGTGI